MRWAGVICVCGGCCKCDGTGRAGIDGFVCPLVDTTGVSGICVIGGGSIGDATGTDCPMLSAIDDEGAIGFDAVNGVLLL